MDGVANVVCWDEDVGSEVEVMPVDESLPLPEHADAPMTKTTKNVPSGRAGHRWPLYGELVGPQGSIDRLIVRVGDGEVKFRGDH